MMISAFRRELKQESGQAIILGVVALLVLAVGVMTTAQLGWAIKEKIQLQHAVDNSVYSTAVLVARSMNFIAWTNRATISQYVTAMVLQSIQTYFDSIVMMVAAASASLYSAAFTLGVAGRILSFIPFTAPIGQAMYQLADGMGEVASRIEDAANNLQNIVDELDIAIAPMVRAIGEINYYVNYIIMQKILGQGFVQKNFVDDMFSNENGFFGRSMSGTDPKFKMSDNTVYNAINGLAGEVEYDSLFDKCSQVIGTDDSCDNGVEDSSVDSDKLKNRSQALMTDLVNASREGRYSEGDLKNFESFRRFTAGTVFQLVLGLIGAPGAVGRFMSFLDPLFPTSNGGTLLSRHIDSSNSEAIGSDGSVFGSATRAAREHNPIFHQQAYAGAFSPDTVAEPADAIIASQHIRPPGGSIGGLIGRALNLFSGGGETLPVDKMIGIQSSSNVANTRHCHFGRIGMMSIDTSAIEEKCSDVCGENKSACENNCNKECTTNDNDEGEETCTWSAKPGGDSNVDCGQCADLMKDMDDNDGDCEAKQQCIDAAKRAASAASGAVGSAVEGFFGGRPARVLVDCETHSGLRRHIFRGVVPYVSFNIQRYEEKQRNRKDPYPAFVAAAHKVPSFMKNSPALGFGGKDFSFQSIGKVEGTGADSESLGISLKNEHCSVNGENCLESYNFDHLNDVNVFGQKGFNAWARSEVYYHRPGTWAEPPNLFNPYWKAKLAPVGPVISDVFGDILGNISIAGYPITKIFEEVFVH